MDQNNFTLGQLTRLKRSDMQALATSLEILGQLTFPSDYSKSTALLRERIIKRMHAPAMSSATEKRDRLSVRRANRTEHKTQQPKQSALSFHFKEARKLVPVDRRSFRVSTDDFLVSAVSQFGALVIGGLVSHGLPPGSYKLISCAAASSALFSIMQRVAGGSWPFQESFRHYESPFQFALEGFEQIIITSGSVNTTHVEKLKQFAGTLLDPIDRQHLRQIYLALLLSCPAEILDGFPNLVRELSNPVEAPKNYEYVTDDSSHRRFSFLASQVSIRRLSQMSNDQQLTLLDIAGPGIKDGAEAVVQRWKERVLPSTFDDLATTDKVRRIKIAMNSSIFVVKPELASRVIMHALSLPLEFQTAVLWNDPDSLQKIIQTCFAKTSVAEQFSSGILGSKWFGKMEAADKQSILSTLQKQTEASTLVYMNISERLREMCALTGQAIA